MKTMAHFQAILDQITYPGLAFTCENPKQGVYTLRVVCPEGTDTVTGEPASWKGRPWLLNPRMTDGEVVQTAFLALKVALEHETRELFKFRGVTVFDPHLNINALVAARRDGVLPIEERTDLRKTA